VRHPAQPSRCSGRNPAMGRAAATALTAATIAAAALGPAAALAAKGNVKFGGDTEEGRKAKLVVDSKGRAIRGAWTLMTDCDGRYEDFRVKITMGSPLDRSTSRGFSDVASESDSDGEVSARYKHDVEGEYTGKHEIEGAISAEVVFRRDGRKYVTCVAEDVGFTVHELKAS